MPRGGFKYAIVGLVILAFGFALSLYLTIPKYSKVFSSGCLSVELEGNRRTYLLDLMDFSMKHGAVWGNVTLHSTIDATLYLTLAYPNGTHNTSNFTLTPTTISTLHLTGCVLEEVFVTPIDDGILTYSYNLFYREEMSIGLIILATMLVLVGVALGYRGVSMIYSGIEEES